MAINEWWKTGRGFIIRLYDRGTLQKEILLRDKTTTGQTRKGGECGQQWL
jgi:hypothetical protein